MSDSAASTPVPKVDRKGASAPSEDALLHAFNEMRTELVSTLYYMLGNQEDAQDVAQDQRLLDRARQESQHRRRDDADADRGEQVVAVHGWRGQGTIGAPPRP